MTLPVIAAAPVTLRHIKHGTASGAVTVVGATFVPQPRKGINGRRGYQSGSFAPALNEEGQGTLTLPNTVGEDGILHRRRFEIFTDPDYHVGDEWIEITQDGRTLFVGTPESGEKRRAQITLTLVDALWMLNTQRETAAGFWCHAPRDVFEHYTKAWRPLVADDFDAGADPAKWTTFQGSDLTGSVRLSPVSSTDTATLTARADHWPGVAVMTDRAWRYEMTYSRKITADGNVYLRLVSDIDASFIDVVVGATGIYGQVVGVSALDAEGVRPAAFELDKLNASLAIEGRDRWVFFYVDGQLRGSLEMRDLTVGAIYRPRVMVQNNGATGSTADIHSLLLRRCDPYLMRGAGKGDYRIPGVLPAGGLRGTYYDEGDILPPLFFSALKYYRRALGPTRQPYARRQDATVNFARVDPPAWQPPTPAYGDYFSARWTGAIYLDLAAADVELRLTDLDGATRLFVGKTRYGEAAIDAWELPVSPPFTYTTNPMRTHLQTSEAGWYPLRIDYTHEIAAGGIILQRSIGGGAWEVVPSSALSPFGIYEAEVRYDSHAEQLKAIALAYGLQYRCDPRSLESGQFPGEVLPKVRVGRDTDKILTPDESTDVGVSVSAGEVIDTLIADASGLGDQANAAQLTNEAINFSSVQPAAAADRHMMIQSAYESLADITDPILLQTRMASMLGLRLTPWEEVTARPRGHRELRQNFPPKALPLPSDLAAFAWEPGDGLRVTDDALDLNDLTPRRIISPSWPFVPDGLGAPSVRFRQRPRSQRDALRALVRAVLSPQRNYQGQLTLVQGTSSHLDGGYSRVALPRNLSDVIRCELVVTGKSDSSTWTVKDYPAAVTIAQFSSVSRLDLTAFVANAGANTAAAMLVSAVGGTGTAVYQLELLVRV